MYSDMSSCIKRVPFSSKDCIASASSPALDSASASTSRRHTQHVLCILSHSEMHFLWKKCPHGISAVSAYVEMEKEENDGDGA